MYKFLAVYHCKESEESPLREFLSGITPIGDTRIVSLSGMFMASFELTPGDVAEMKRRIRDRSMVTPHDGAQKITELYLKENPPAILGTCELFTVTAAPDPEDLEKTEEPEDHHAIRRLFANEGSEASLVP